MKVRYATEQLYTCERDLGVMVINVFGQFREHDFFFYYSIMVASPKPGVYNDM